MCVRALLELELELESRAEEPSWRAELGEWNWRWLVQTKARLSPCSGRAPAHSFFHSFFHSFIHSALVYSSHIQGHPSIRVHHQGQGPLIRGRKYKLARS